MSQNKLILNSEKTHLLVMSSERKHQKYGDFGITLDTGNEVIKPKSEENYWVELSQTTCFGTNT